MFQPVRVSQDAQFLIWEAVHGDADGPSLA